MDSVAIAEAADLLVATRLELGPFGGFPAHCAPQSEAEGYAVQKALHDRLTGRLGRIEGYKIGCTTKVMQDYLGIDHPCSGGIFESTIYRNDAIVPHDKWRRVGVECEIAVRLSAALEPAGAPYDRESVADAVESCMAAIEIVDDRYLDYTKLDVATLIADDFFNTGCIVGEAREDWRDLDLAALRGTTEINGVEAGAGSGADVLGHPLEALALLANESAKRGETIEAGSIVLTGSIVQTKWLEPGDHAVCRLEGLGAVSLKTDI
jgi:2-oxo-3-hexenedioate decarboxylase/2-keto-4-pentenoate hydratase